MKPSIPSGWRSLRVALIVSHVAVAVVALLAVLWVAEITGASFYEGHLDHMAQTYGGAQPDAMHLELQQGFTNALNRSLLIGLVVGVPLALLAGIWAAHRVLLPVARISQAAGRIATGGYRERLPEAAGDELAGLMTEFNRLAASLEAIEAHRVELMNNVAHELRTPLMGLQGYAEGLSDGVFNPSEAAERISREVARLKKLTDDLSQVSNLEAGNLHLALEPIDICALAQEAFARFEPLFEGRLRLEITKPVYVNADRDRLTQVLVNLLSNALRHAPQAGTVLRVTASTVEAQLEVSDNGPGIPESALERIFERFYRLDPARAGGGSGVGLTISRHLVNAMNGRLEAQNNPAGGARFILHLPLEA